MPSDPNATEPAAASPDAPGGRAPRPARWPYALVILAIVFAGWGMLKPDSDDPSKAVDPADVLLPGSAKGFNLLFVTFDTTRPDHLGCYGYADAHTPTVDSLAAHGVRFDDAVTSVPLTLPSHSVMMTGEYPFKLGVHDNGQHLSGRNVTLAEVLSTNGYATAAFVGAFVLDQRWGIDQGFDVYDFHVKGANRIALDSIVAERPADAVSNSALRWLKERSAAQDKRPFFMWLHYFDPHYPYESPLISLPGLENRPYDAEIAMADAQLKRVLDQLDEQKLLDDTLVVFVTDHGEGFFEKDEAYHGIFLYETTLHTAIMLSNPRLFTQPYRVDDRVVGTVDLMPTILELLDIRSNIDFAGRSLRAPRDPDRAVYIETEFPLANGCAALYGLRRHHDKFISAPESEYYDLERDPGETDNLYDEAEPAVAALKAQLRGLLEGTAGRQPTEPGLTPEEQRALGALGYTGAKYGREGLPDPKEHIHVINQITDVMRLKAHGQIEEALKLAEEIAAESESWNVPVMKQAELYEALGRLNDSARVLLDYARKFPSDKSYYDYAIALFKLERYDDCLNILKSEVISRDPKLGAAHLMCGKCLLKLQRYPDALAACEQAQRVDAERLGNDLVECLNIAREKVQP
ncbi:MAG: sulfatase-like hydrolase/transferase [Phycisphaerales bacterium]|nr:sulfatase-like hydrolase/transferase [Phycisphaerales bacterium]